MKTFRKNKYTLLSICLKYSFVFIITLMFVLPVFAQVCTGVDNDGNKTPIGCDKNLKGDTGDVKGGTGDLKGGTGDLKGTTGVEIQSGIENPLGNTIVDIPTFILAILNFVLYVGIPIVALAIIYSGFLFVTASGNSEKLKSAKKTLLYTLIGAALLLGSLVIAQSIKGTVEEIIKTT